ncbi:hypothetical protein GCM10007872_28820 [Gluconobacter sphaericus NBRC 12467]|uniref:Uncharacterized protein n=1 Tax=Gluconobacter sphaericus NBRC 12467 TaxID=1307951 RepID=A0AA37WBB0_9PROT|nr:hypothetical protein AA12467_0218 [Gluconobacter sphaericus NBRC 12467]GEB42984.1 hypothetical protein GSP01_17660 [Gluconobacter sphaericus NBRC 12467]GLQ85972.1 hypothetical protein GCM10007872_28820 [Gluconobacter sphaericus NBRC 12467]
MPVVENLTVLGHVLRIAAVTLSLVIRGKILKIQYSFLSNNIIPRVSIDDIIRFYPSGYSKKYNDTGIGKAEPLSL